VRPEVWDCECDEPSCPYCGPRLAGGDAHRPPTVSGEWECFSIKAIALDAPLLQRSEMRLAYYAAFQTALAIASRRVLVHGDDRPHVSQLAQLEEECRRFCRAYGNRLEPQERTVGSRPPLPKNRLEVGVSADRREVVLNHPDIAVNEHGGYIVFSPAQARSLGNLLLRKADECVDAG
jgi:hypothetical protein